MDDFVPEHCIYKDEGCDLFPSCLHCPLAKCRHDEPGRHAGKELRNDEIRRLHAAGMSVAGLAQRFKVSRRTVYRAIAGDSGMVAAGRSSAEAPGE